MEPVFPVGYKNYHPRKELNFQFNRFASWCQDQALHSVAPKIRNFRDWKREIMALATAAENEGRHLHAAGYYRLAEFFIAPSDPDKEAVYTKFQTIIQDLLRDEGIVHHRIPYADTFLPAIHLKAQKYKGTIVLHGGYDSFIEEIAPIFLYLRSRGYDVVAFEGPGQGAALKKYKLPMTFAWEKPLGAVLDHFKLKDITLIGFSLGGYLAMRAAAFDPRVAQIVAYDVMYDFLECFLNRKGPLGKYVMKLLLRAKAAFIVNSAMAILMKIDLLAEWGIKHGMYTLGLDTPYQLFQALQAYTTRDISRKVRQDVLLLAGSQDHYVPISQFYKQMKALTNAHSITGRIFTAREHAQNHCQIGNVRLALDVIINWIDACTLKGSGPNEELPKKS